MNATRTTRTDEAETEAETLADELTALKGQIARLGERLGGADGATLERAKAIADDLGREWRRVEGDIRSATRDNPWRSLGAAALVGFVLGLILRR